MIVPVIIGLATALGVYALTSKSDDKKPDDKKPSLDDTERKTAFDAGVAHERELFAERQKQADHDREVAREAARLAHKESG